MTEQQLEAKLEAAEEGTPEYCSLLSDLAELKLHNVSSSECQRRGVQQRGSMGAWVLLCSSRLHCHHG